MEANPPTSPPAAHAPNQAEKQSKPTNSNTGMIPEDYQPDPQAFTLYRKTARGKTTYWIKFEGDDTFVRDQERRPRRALATFVEEGQMLSTEVMDPIIMAQREVYEAIFKPIELVYVLAAGMPPFGGADRLANKRGFKPEGHQIIIRIIHFDDPLHWTLLMHFIAIETVVVWDGLGNLAGGTTKRLSAQDASTIRDHVRWTKGTVAEAKGKDGTCWKRQEFLGHGTQDDKWSCGLWCLARLEDLYRTLSERIAIDIELDYEKVVETLKHNYGMKGVDNVDLERANLRLQLAHALGYEVKALQ